MFGASVCALFAGESLSLSLSLALVLFCLLRLSLSHWFSLHFAGIIALSRFLYVCVWSSREAAEQARVDNASSVSVPYALRVVFLVERACL